MPGKRVEFRPTVLVCDGSPERLHDSTPRPRQRNPANRQQQQAQPGTPTAPPPPPPPLPTAVVVPVQSPVVPPPAVCPAVQQAREALRAPETSPLQPLSYPSPAVHREKPRAAVPTAAAPQAAPARVRTEPIGYAPHPSVPRGRGDGADERRSHTLPTRGSAAAAACGAVPSGPAAARSATWRPGHGGGASGGTLAAHQQRQHQVPLRPRSVAGPAPAPAACWPPESQSSQCFQCAGGARCFPSSSANAAAAVTNGVSGDSSVPWPQRWRQPAAGCARRPTSAPQPLSMSDYQYTELDSGAGGERRTWVKPGRNGTNGVRVEGERMRPAADSASAACLLNHEAGPDGVAIQRPASASLRFVGWLCRSQVIAFICGLIVLLLMALALASSDWLLSDGWRQGLFAHCTEEDAGRPLPFNLPFEPGCHRARDVPYIIVSEALAICCMLLDAFATLMAGLGLWSKDTNKKYQYYRAAVYVMIISLISILIALVVYPVCFAQELEQSNRTVWEFGWAYGVGWGAAIFLFGGVILLLCDKESEEIYYKERTIMHDERA